MSAKTDNFINKNKRASVIEGVRNKIPPSITLAQAILESGWGESGLSVNANNYFGIKANSSWKGEIYNADTHEYYNGVLTYTSDDFRAYKNPLASFKDHSLFLHENPRYSNLFELDFLDYKGWAHGLKSSGYATSPTYAEKLINLIEGILSTSDAYASSGDNTWAPFPDNGQKYVVGYIEDKDSILVSYSDKNLSTALTSAAIYHFQTKSWTPLFLSLSNQQSSDTGNFSNFITDNNGDVLYYHHKSGRETLGINEIKKWHHDAIQDSDYNITTKNFGFITKDITFDSISSTKNLYRVYITYKVKRDGTDSAVAVTGAVNGTGTFNVAFDAASTFQGTSTACYGSSTLDETDGKWKTAELKFATPSEVKGINSFQLQITAFPGAFDFEINDISIEYRTVKRT